MSEQTTMILIYHQDLYKLQKWVQKKKKKVFLLQATEDWTCLCVENDLKISEKWAGMLSKELQKVVIFFGDYDEYGWRCDFWENGMRKIHISIPYEMSNKLKIELPNPEIWLPYASSKDTLNSLNILLSSCPLETTGSELFKKSFGIERLTSMCFDSLSSCSDEELKSQGIITLNVNNSKKSSTGRLPQIVSDIFQKPLEEKGYLFVSQPGKRDFDNQYIFSKKIGFYEFWIRLDKIEKQNRFKLFYYPPYYLPSVEEWMINNHLRPEIIYSNELQLRTGLQELLSNALTIGIPWLEKQIIEDVNLEELFYKIVDPLMKNHGFSRLQSNESDYNPRLMFIYSTEDSKWRVLFSHVKSRPMIDIYMKRYNQTVRGVIHYPDKNSAIGENYFLYKTRTELTKHLIDTSKAFFYLLERESNLTYDNESTGFNF